MGEKLFFCLSAGVPGGAEGQALLHDSVRVSGADAWYPYLEPVPPFPLLHFPLSQGIGGRESTGMALPALAAALRDG